MGRPAKSVAEKKATRNAAQQRWRARRRVLADGTQHDPAVETSLPTLPISPHPPLADVTDYFVHADDADADDADVSSTPKRSTVRHSFEFYNVLLSRLNRYRLRLFKTTIPSLIQKLPSTQAPTSSPSSQHRFGIIVKDQHHHRTVKTMIWQSDNNYLRSYCLPLSARIPGMRAWIN